jgi:hypothetical protein
MNSWRFRTTKMWLGSMKDHLHADCHLYGRGSDTDVDASDGYHPILPAFNLDCSKIVLEGYTLVPKNSAESIEEGEIYDFAGYKWIVAEIHHNTATLQSMDPVYIGPHPSIFESDYWNTKDVKYGFNIVSFSKHAKELYDKIKVCDTERKGLYLIDKSKLNPENIYAKNYKKAFAKEGREAWLDNFVEGDVSVRYGYSVKYEKNSMNIGLAYSFYNYELLPSFDLDLTKVITDGKNIVIKS